MTYIQPNKKSIISRLSLLLLSAVILMAFAVVILYNKTVDLEHGIKAMRNDIKKTEAKNTELKEKIFALFDSSNFKETFGGNLIQDKNPEYLEIKLEGITQASVPR